MSDRTDMEVTMLSSDITAALAAEVASTRRREAAEHRRAREAGGGSLQASAQPRRRAFPFLVRRLAAA